MTEPTIHASETVTPGAPLIFISHDSRDADFAEAFSKLLKSVSAGMLKSFRSSDKKGSEGIEFGDEWYKRLMLKLESASDVVCLLTERSLDRPWILYEAGVAKGKLETPVHGVALGVPLGRVSTGPFYQFQNSDDSEDSLTKLVLQLCRRVPELEPDEGVVKTQVQAFKKTCEEVLKKLTVPKKQEKEEPPAEAATAKVLEEMKLIVRDLPGIVTSTVMERSENDRPRKYRRLHPMMIMDMAKMISRRRDDPIGLLLIASFLKDDFPWLYELGLEAYHTVKSGTPEEIQEALSAFRDATQATIHGPFPFIEEAGLPRNILREFPSIIHNYMENLFSPSPRPKLLRRPIPRKKVETSKEPEETS